MDEKERSKFAYYAPLCLKFLLLLFAAIGASLGFRLLDEAASDAVSASHLLNFVEIFVWYRLFRYFWKKIFEGYDLPIYIKAIFVVVFIAVGYLALSFTHTGSVFGYLERFTQEPDPMDPFAWDNMQGRLEALEAMKNK